MIDEFARILVQDEGPGIPEADRRSSSSASTGWRQPWRWASRARASVWPSPSRWPRPTKDPSTSSTLRAGPPHFGSSCPAPCGADHPDHGLSTEGGRDALTFDRALATEEIRHVVLAYPEASDTGDLPGVGRFMGGVRFGPPEVPERTWRCARPRRQRPVTSGPLSTTTTGFHTPNTSSRTSTSSSRPTATPRRHLGVCGGAGETAVSPAVHLHRWLPGCARAPGRRLDVGHATGVDGPEGDMSFHVFAPERFHGR